MADPLHLPDAQVHRSLEALWRSGGTAYAGLSSTVPSKYLDSGVTEFDMASYERVALPTDATGFAAAVARAIETIVTSTWPAPLEDWPEPVAIVLFDTATKGTGNILGAVLITAVPILAGSPAPVAPPGVIRFASI